MNITQGRPSETTDDGDFARQLLAILGPAYQGGDGTNVAADMLALGGQLADVRAILGDAVSEAFAGEALDLLSEYETLYGLPVQPDLTPATRQNRLLAKVRAARGSTPNNMLTSIQTFDATASIIEKTVPMVPRDPDTTGIYGHAGGMRGVFRFVVVLSQATMNDAIKKAGIVALLETMKPAHTNYTLTANAVFKVDDAASKLDQTALGA